MKKEDLFLLLTIFRYYPKYRKLDPDLLVRYDTMQTSNLPVGTSISSHSFCNYNFTMVIYSSIFQEYFFLLRQYQHKQEFFHQIH